MNNTFTEKNIPQSNANSFLSYLTLGLVFLLPSLTLTTKFGVGMTSFGFLLVGIICWRKALLVRHLTEIRWVLTALLLSFGFALLVMGIHPEYHLRSLEKPFRMLSCVTVLLTVLALRPSRKALWYGLIAGTAMGAVFICYQRWGLGIDRPGGLINSITFGDLELCMGMMCLAGVLDFRGRQVVWPALGAVAGLVGSVATGTRGGWIAVLFAGLLFLFYGHFLRTRMARAVTLLVFSLLVGTYFVDQTGARERFREGVSEVKTYFAGGYAFTNVGVRLELWKGALMLIEEHPWRIAGPKQVETELKELVAAGRLQPFVLDAEHFHNDMLQQLVFGGIPGLLVWLGTLVAPLLFFLRICRTHESASPSVIAPALAGLLLVIGYFSFGLTEVIFWSMMSCMFYAQMVFLLMGLCLNARDDAQVRA